MESGEKVVDQIAAIECVGKLAFLEECREKLVKDNNCVAALEKLAESNDSDISLKATRTLSRIKGLMSKLH